MNDHVRDSLLPSQPLGSATANVELSGKNWFLEVFRFQIVQTRVIIPDRDIYLLDVEYFITLDQYQTFAQNV